MDRVACNLCGCQDAEAVREGPDYAMGCPGSFRLVRCRCCGLVYQDPRPSPDEIPAYYPPEYLDMVGENTRRLPWLSAIEWRWMMERRYSVIRRALQEERGRLLDVGCGTGGFLYAMKLRGWDVMGIDPNPSAVARAQEWYDVPARVGRLQDIWLSSETFDVVTLWDVVEHLDDPKLGLRLCWKLLRPDGVLVMSTPNLASWQARLFGGFWQELDLPRHLYLFSETTMSRLLQATGFDCVQLHTRSRWGDIAASLRYMTENRIGSGWFVRAVHRSTVSIVPRLVTLPYRWLAEAVGQGSTLIVAARRAQVASQPPLELG